MNATLTDFYNALKQAVMFSPQYVVENSSKGMVWPCRQLQTFRVMQRERGAELKASNLGATICDKGKPFFWSRKWHENKYNPNNITFDYPLLAVTETSFGVDKQAFQQRTKRCYNFQVVVVDQYTADCEKNKCDGCNGRTIHEIFADTEALLFDVLYFLSNVRGATLRPGGEEVFLNADYLNYLKENGNIDGWDGGADWGGLLNSQSVSAYRIAIEAEKIYGTAVNFQACFHNCEAATYNFNLPDFGVLAQEFGCKNCG